MLNYATVGSSWITEQMIQAATYTQQYHLKAVYSRHLDKAKQLAQKTGADYYTDNFNNLLFDPEIDLVYIASPNSLHAQQALEIVEHKKHVIVEKPLFETSAQWHQVFEAADRNHVFVFEAALHYHSRNYGRIRPLLKQKIKELDQPLMGANFNIGQYSSRYDTYREAVANDWPVPNAFSSEYAGGSLMDLGTYPLYIALDLYGMPQSVSYRAQKDDQGVDLSGHALLIYPQFQVGIFLSKTVHSNLSSEIYLGQETVVIEDISRLTKVKLVNRSEEKVQLVDYIPANPMFDELLSFAEMIQAQPSIHNQVRYENWRQLSLQVIQVMEALRQSAK
ncbi:Gfo/Idh/MocA family oxidoreductase [Facklamia hominis]|uniref:Gfo/Idh/MocA family oxidoreductase n=1 Tax=Facklamia hominis TaxID=178214 RepID=UPI000C7BDD8C|nr:Gfo/Idh/MocA family oxidoreductase [Facklamia hominis]PKY93476.1 gfo/Idh/MocA family oxidoreductase [Facklamia hominis]RYC97817.1 Gfo/Idh/MocA family oxidoreductase [Facklamia hominis]WPJ91151.1 Gfo/Idh/MocA family oxidoreductase [Facklamia hominis]